VTRNVANTASTCSSFLFIQVSIEMQLFIFFFPKYIYYIQTPNACFSFNSFFQVQAVLFLALFKYFFFKTPVAYNGKNVQQVTKLVYMVQKLI